MVSEYRGEKCVKENLPREKGAGKEKSEKQKKKGPLIRQTTMFHELCTGWWQLNLPPLKVNRQ